MSEVGASSKYWRKRFEILEKRANLKSQSHIKSMVQQYAVAKKTTEKELAVLYNRLAGNNGLTSMGEAKKLLTKNELKDFHMTLQEYTALAKENGITGDWTQQLENASLKYRISRLEAMKIQLEQQANILMAKETNAIEKAVKEAFENSYYGAGFEIAKGTSVGKTLFRIDDKTINTVIHKPWAEDGKNFSERVWGQHRPQLVKSLHTKLTSAIMRGEGPDKAIKEITGAFDVSMSSAARLVQTEEAYFSSVAQRQCFNDLDVEEYEIIATLDSHTSDICQGLDGKVYKMDEFEAGVTAPPFHPRCRTTTAPYFADEVSTRAARNPDTGKTEQVPSNMTYQQWRNEYVKDPEAWKAKQDKKEAEANAKAKADAERKAREQAEAKAKAEAEARAKAEAEAAQRAREAEKKEFVPAKDLKEAKTRLEKLTGAKVGLSGIGVDGANMILDETERVLKKFPELKGCASDVRMRKFDPHVGGVTEVRPMKGEKPILTMNNRKFGDRYGDRYQRDENVEKSVLDKAKEFDNKNGWHPLGTKYQSDVAHEWGHVAEFTLCERNVFKPESILRGLGAGEMVSYQYQINDYVQDIVETALRRKGIWHDQDNLFYNFWMKNVTKEMSEYASKSMSETIAEAFSEYIDSPNPRPWAQAICEEVKTRLGAM